MNKDAITQYSQQIAVMINTTTAREVGQQLEKLIAAEQWELLGRLLPTASEIAARRIVAQLLEHNKYDFLAWAACLRRQLRQPGLEAAGGRVAERVFRDIDAEDDTAGVPEHIMAEAQEIADSAVRHRSVARQRAAEMDRDPIRDLIVDQLAQRLPEAEAGEALLVIAKGCPFDPTRRKAAMKLANHKQWIKQLASENRVVDLIAISESTNLNAVAESIARLLDERIEQLQQTDDQRALRFIAEHHPTREMRQAAQEALA